MLPFFYVKWTRGSLFAVILFFLAIAVDEGGLVMGAGFLFVIIGLIALWNYLGHRFPTGRRD